MILGRMRAFILGLHRIFNIKKVVPLLRERMIQDEFVSLRGVWALKTGT